MIFSLNFFIASVWFLALYANLEVALKYTIPQPSLFFKYKMQCRVKYPGKRVRRPCSSFTLLWTKCVALGKILIFFPLGLHFLILKMRESVSSLGYLLVKRVHATDVFNSFPYRISYISLFQPHCSFWMQEIFCAAIPFVHVSLTTRLYLYLHKMST